jgi:thiol-disulfide isomerase/thioredoxin
MEGDQERPLQIYESYLASGPPPERQRMTKSLILITLGSMNRPDEMAKRLETYRTDLTPNSIVNSLSTIARLYAEAGDEKKTEIYTKMLFDFGKQSKDGKAVDGPVTAHINWQIKRLEAANDPGKLNDFIHYVRTEFANNKSVMGNLDSREVFRLVLNKPAKELEIAYFVNGTKTDLKSLRGKVVMLDFFAHWCGPCIADFPIVRDLQQRYEKRGLAILGMTSVYGYYQGDRALTPEQEVEQMKGHFAKEYQVTWPMVFGVTKTNETSYGVGYIPHLVLIDRNGIVRFAKVGRSDEKELEAEIQKLLSEASN